MLSMCYKCGIHLIDLGSSFYGIWRNSVTGCQNWLIGIELLIELSGPPVHSLTRAKADRWGDLGSQRKYEGIYDGVIEGGARVPLLNVGTCITGLVIVLQGGAAAGVVWARAADPNTSLNTSVSDHVDSDFSRASDF